MYELRTMTVKAIDLRTGDRIVTSANHANSVQRVEVIDDAIVNVWLEGRAGIHDRPWYEFDAGVNVQIQRPTPKADESKEIETMQTEMTPAQLLALGRTAYANFPPSLDAARGAERHASVSAVILSMYAQAKQVGDTDTYEMTYHPALLTSAQQVAGPHTGGSPLSAAHVLANEALRLAANERFEAMTRPVVVEAPPVSLDAIEKMPARTEPGVSDSREVGPISVDVHGPWDRPVFEVGRWDTEEGAFVHVASFSRDEADALHTALGHTLLG